MGEIADMILDGTLDEQTGEYIGEPCGYPRTLQGKSSSKSTGKRFKEYKSLIKEYKAKGLKPNQALTKARQDMNSKHGHGWRYN